MATTLKLRRGTTAQHSTFTGTEGEVTVDTDKDTVVVHDGTTAGGFPLVGEKGNQTITGIKTFDNGLKTDTISEETSAAGVTVDGVVLKDNGASLGGDLTFTGTGNRITGDFSNATLANRVWLQTSTANSAFSSGVLPSGTAARSLWAVVSQSDPTNASTTELDVENGVESRVRASRFGTGTYLPMTFYTGGSERMRIDTSGNVGIGTTSPGAKLSISANGSNQNALSFINTQTSGRTWIMGQGAGTGEADDFGLYDATSNHPVSIYKGGASGFWQWRTNGTERARITSGGDFLVGTTSNPSGTSTKLVVIGEASASAIRGAQYVITNNSGDLSYPVASFQKYDNDQSSSQVFLRFLSNQGSNGNGQINGNGSNQAAFGSFSDRRLKENIVDLEPQLANICALRPVEFDYIESEGGGHQIGFVAQEIQEVYPDVVGERSDGMLTLSGFNKTEARLIKAIQELKAELDTVKAELATLKGQA
jgi:hypothetical protein